MRVSAAVFSFVLVACVSLAPASAWWCGGHMLVAQVAKQYCTPTAWTGVEKYVGLLGRDYPASPEPLSSACWADDIKELGVDGMDTWHYINLPVVRDPLYDLPHPVANNSNVAWAISTAANTLFSKVSVDVDKARAIRFLIHFVGDAHQPLHAATLYSQQQFPSPLGDVGGNFFHIKGANVTSLHKFFDSGAGLWDFPYQRPLQSDGFNWIESWANFVCESYPASKFSDELKIDDPYVWLGESYHLAVNKAYDTPVNGEVSKQYISDARDVCQSQVALGGYRLGQLFNRIFDPSHSDRR